MASTIVIPARPDVGAYSDTIATAMVTEKGNYDARVANELIDGLTAAVTDIEALQAGTSITGVNGTTIAAGGSLTTGQVLRATGAGAAAWGAVNLAAVAAVTGVLPAANVGGVNGATVPAAGALTTGNGPYVSGASALTYSALNLAGGAGWVTGELPGANQALAVSGVSQGAVTGAQAAAIDAGMTASKKTVTIGHADLTDADGSQTINIGTALPANARIVGVDLHTYTAFSGGGANAVTVDIGTAGDVDALIDGADLFAGAVDGGPATIPQGIRPNKTMGAVQLIATVAADVNVADLSAGAITIDVLYIVLA